MSAVAAPAVLREAVPADAPAVLDLEQVCFEEDGWSAGVVADALGSTGRHVVVAEVGDVVVGYAVLSVAGEVADLERVAVHPAHRRTGLATALLGRVRDRAREAGAERLLLEVSTANPGARAFYAAHGAVELDRRRRYYCDGSDALVLQLPLGARPGPEEVDRG